MNECVLLPYCYCYLTTATAVVVTAGMAQATEVVDEVIAEHPGPPVSPFSPGSRLAARAPVHNALTASMRSHFPALTAAQHAPQTVSGSGCGAEGPPTPQVGTVQTLQTVRTDFLACC